MQEPVTLKLQDPITFGGETVTELVIRPPRAKDFRGMKNVEGDMERNIAVLSNLTGKAPVLLDELSIRDLSAAGSIVDSFSGAKKTDEAAG